MPELTAIHIVLFAAMAILGVIIGWILRGNRARNDKVAVNAGWREQIGAQRKEHSRLTEQNRGLMEQLGQYQASNKDANNRAKELAEAIQEAYSRRDQLQRDIKDIRSDLEIAMTERDKLKSNVATRTDDSTTVDAKDAKIKRLKVELENWQGRVPPLLERYRLRDEEADRLEVELTAARNRISELEESDPHGQTRIDPVDDPDALTDGRNASNDSLQETNSFAALGDSAFASSDSDDDFDNAHDQLQLIKGIGPAIERTLNEMGIFRFHQIAEMSEYDIDRVANRLKGFHSRIYREDWIGQARDLRDQTNNG